MTLESNIKIVTDGHLHHKNLCGLQNLMSWFKFIAWNFCESGQQNFREFLPYRIFLIALTISWQMYPIASRELSLRRSVSWAGFRTLLTSCGNSSGHNSAGSSVHAIPAIHCAAELGLCTSVPNVSKTWQEKEKKSIDIKGYSQHFEDFSSRTVFLTGAFLHVSLHSNANLLKVSILSNLNRESLGLYFL